MLAGIMLLASLLGWDEDDEDRFDKLRSMSGSMPTMFADGDGTFNAAGWLKLHSIHLLLQIHSENRQLALYKEGLKPYTDMLALKSAAMGPTVDTYQDVFKNFGYYLTGNEKGFYTRDTGPYDWQKKGWSKISKKLYKGIWFNRFYVRSCISYPKINCIPRDGR